MPTIRQVHVAFREMIAEQEAALAGVASGSAHLRAEADRLAAGAVAATDAVVRASLRGPADLEALAAHGEAAPLERLREATEGRDGRRSQHMRVASGNLRVARQLERERVDALSDRDTAVAGAATILRKVGVALAEAGLPCGTEDARLLLDRPARRTGWLAALFSRRAREERRLSELLLAGTGLDLPGTRERLAVLADERDRAELAAGRLSRAILGSEEKARDASRAADALPDDGQIFAQALEASRETFRTRRGVLALRALAGDALPLSAVAVLARAERLAKAADGIERQALAMSAFRDKLSSNMGKLRKGVASVPARSVRMDLDGLRKTSADIARGCGSLADGLAAAVRANASLSAAIGDEGEAALLALSRTDADAGCMDGGWWDLAGLLWMLQLAQQDAAVGAVASCGGLDQGALAAALAQLPPDSASALAAACGLAQVPDGPHLPDTAPLHLQDTLPSGPDHASLAPVPDFQLPGFADSPATLPELPSFGGDIPAFTVDIPAFTVDVPAIDVGNTGQDFGSSIDTGSW